MSPERDSFKTLSTIAQILQKSDAHENPLAHIVTMVREQLHVDVCSLYLLHEKSLILVATEGLLQSSVGQVRMEIHEGLTGLAVEKLQPIIVNNASHHPRFKYFPETGEEAFQTFVGLPLIDHKNVVGVLTIQTKADREFVSNDIELLKLIAFQLAGVIQNVVTLEILKSGEDKDSVTHAQVHGTPVAPGFGLGPAFFIHAGIAPTLVSQAASVKAKSEKEEWGRLEKAIEKTSDDFLKLEKKLEKKFSKSESDIFYSHRMILSDKSFLKKLKQVIHGGSSAVQSVRDVIGEYIQEFEKIEDPHIREKIFDLEDIQSRILEHLLGAKPKKNENWEGVLVAETLVPSDTMKLDPDRIRGIITVRGGPTSHAAILARSLGIPAVMGVPGILSKIQPGDVVIVDGNLGNIYINPEKEVLKEYEKIQEKYADHLVHLQILADKPAITTDHHRIKLEANVGLMSGLQKLKYFGAEAVGLYRTEFPFMVKKKILSQNEQYELYSKIISESQGLPVTFRLLDPGGDKPIESLGLIKEANPFLGFRSLRFTLSRPEILKDQIAALLRASSHGPIRILVPMVSGLEEAKQIKKIYEEVQDSLRHEGISFRQDIPLGFMIEIPSAVWLSPLLIELCDFFSIGTNDLVQYTLAVDRNNERVSQFFEPLHPAVIRSLHYIIGAARKAGKPVSICGEMAGDSQLTPLLVGLGVTGLSMIPSNIPLVKESIMRMPFSDAQALANAALQAQDSETIKSLLRTFHSKAIQSSSVSH